MKKISKIKKINNKYTIILSDNSSLSFYSDTLIKYNLLNRLEMKLWLLIIKKNKRIN